MKTWWMGAGLLAAWAATAGVGFAQGQMSTPFGPARCPDPLPCGDSNPPLTPGPLTPLQAPPGPPDCLSLPDSVSNANPCTPPFERDIGVYFEAGAIGLQPNKLGHQPIAQITPDRLKDGTPPTPNLPVGLDSHDIATNLMWGVVGTLGYQDENRALELTGFGLFQRTFSGGATNPGRLDTQFVNAPFGFSGDNGLFLHDDTIGLQRQTLFANGEINYRYSDLAVTSFELILGVRYMFIDGSYQIAVGQDNITFPLANGGADPLREATYRVETKVNFAAPQIGFEYNYAFGHGVSAGINGKAAIGAAYVEYRESLYRGDGFQGFDRTARDGTFMQAYELNAFVEIHLTERALIRGGYKTMWLLNASTPQDQVDFNLSSGQNLQKSTGDYFLQGPTLELALFF
jgi:hypothetical protein